MVATRCACLGLVFIPEVVFHWEHSWFCANRFTLVGQKSNSNRIGRNESNFITNSIEFNSMFSGTRYEYQVLGSTSIPARLDTLVYWEPFSWLTSVGTTRNTVIRLGWSRIGLAVLNLHAAGVGLIGRPAVISGRYNKCHSLQLQNHYAHFPPLHHTHIHAKHNRAEPVMGNGYGFRGIVCWPWQEKSCVIG